MNTLGVDGNAVGPSLFEALDEHGRSSLDYRELYTGMALLLPLSEEEQTEFLFAMLDENGSGRVSAKEMEAFLWSIAPETTRRLEVAQLAAQMCREADANGSGLVTFQARVG